MSMVRRSHNLAWNLKMLLPRSPVFVRALPAIVTGVDFLGLGAVNERLIADFLPGISNVTRYMRVYSVMSWVAWRFEQYFRDELQASTAQQVKTRYRAFQEKVELLFTWGNLRRGIGMVGSDRPYPDHDRDVSLSFAQFGKSTISWMDAAVYGPSLKVNSGMGFLFEPTPGSYRPTEDGRALAAALDASLQASKYYPRLADVSDHQGSRKVALDLAERWSVLDSTPQERRVFARVFAPEEATAPEGSTAATRAIALRLVRAAVAARGGQVTEQGVREALARGFGAAGALRVAVAEKPAQALWAGLQVRQLQRLGHESLLRWVELSLFDPPVEVPNRTTLGLADLCAELAAHSYGMSSSGPLSDVTARLVEPLKGQTDLYLVGSRVPRVDPITALRRLSDVSRTEDEFKALPAAALDALCIAAMQAKHFAADQRYRRVLDLGLRDRLSLATLVDIFSQNQEKSLRDFFRLLIESCTVSQHLATAAARLEPGKNKFRLMPSEEGLKPLIRDGQIQRLNVTADRMQTALSLMADCGILARNEERSTFLLPR